MPRDLHVETAVFPWPTWNIKRSKSFANCHSAKQSRFSFTSAKRPNIPGTSRIPACQRRHTLHLWKLRFGGFEKVCVPCLGRQICYRSVCPMKLVFLPQMHKWAVWDGRGGERGVRVLNKPGHLPSRPHLPHCNVNPWFFYSYLPSPAPKLQLHYE